MEAILSKVIQGVAMNVIGNVVENALNPDDKNVQEQNDNDRFETLFSVDSEEEKEENANPFAKDCDCVEVYGMAGQFVGYMAAGPIGGLLGGLLGPILGSAMDDIKSQIFGGLPGYDQAQEVMNNISGGLVTTLMSSQGLRANNNIDIADILSNEEIMQTLINEDTISAFFNNQQNALVA